jgi:membrane peptidoglycan carboxypeptidase
MGYRFAAYLDVVYFGEDAYRVTAASQRYFGVQPSALTLARPLLAGLIGSP